MSAALGVVSDIDIVSNIAHVTTDSGASSTVMIENIASPIQIGDMVTINDNHEIEVANIDWGGAGGIGLTHDLLYRPPTFAPPNPHIQDPFLRPEADWHVTQGDPDRMVVNAIAALGENNQLALNNRLPWRYPEDLELYHNKVRGKSVIMGRATFESVPNSFHEIPENIIIVSTTMDDSDDDNIHEQITYKKP